MLWPPKIKKSSAAFVAWVRCTKAAFIYQTQRIQCTCHLSSSGLASIHPKTLVRARTHISTPGDDFFEAFRSSWAISINSMTTSCRDGSSANGMALLCSSQYLFCIMKRSQHTSLYSASFPFYPTRRKPISRMWQMRKTRYLRALLAKGWP
jgi:hypothetical protein